MASERDRIALEHAPLVRSIATRILRTLPRETDVEDLVAAGTRGLVEAADRYDASRGVAFSTFAYYRIRGAIFDEVRHMSWIPRRQFERTRVQEAIDDVAEGLVAGASPPRGEDAARGLASALRETAMAFVATVEAFEETEAATPSPEAAAAARQDTGRVRSALAGMPEREREMIRLRYYEDLTLEEAGRRLGLSKSWASRLHTRALRLLGEQLSGPRDR
jgi:RNA polymerase sigma factor for flagellar operon FliA